MNLNLTMLAAILLLNFPCKSLPADTTMRFFKASNNLIQYTGRIDFSDPEKPKCWAPGTYIKAKFSGTACAIGINDEGRALNYIWIIVDDNEPVRIQLKKKVNTIQAARNLPRGEHTITICKNTEANIGYIEFTGITCEALIPLSAQPERKIEFIGNSITCGTGSDRSLIECGGGQWHDQHNAYMSYGPLTARKLKAQWHLTAYSGIGLTHSCCNLTMTMPDIFDKLNLHTDNGIPWDFSRYQPDVVTICLGQNDGIQDSVKFCNAYVNFISTVRSHYPEARIVCLTSPMANDDLTGVLKNYLTGIVNHKARIDNKVHKFFFSRSYNSGCDGHPDLDEHQLLADELYIYLKELMQW